MIRVWIRNKRGGRKWIEAMKPLGDLDDAIRAIAAAGPKEYRLTDEKGAEILLVTVRFKAQQFVTKPRLRSLTNIFN